MAQHRVYALNLTTPQAGDVVRVLGEEAHHAVRVKRVEPGEAIELLSGRGLVARGRVRDTRKERGDWVVEIEIAGAGIEPPLAPRVEVLSAVPKGPRVADLVDQLSQVGAAGWGGLSSARSQGDARELKRERLERVAIEASKQSGRAWTMEILDPIAFEAALVDPAGATRIVLADATGHAYRRSGAASIRVLVGPEGGWTPAELERARAAGCTLARFGPHVMRIETAAVVACACVLNTEMDQDAEPGGKQGEPVRP